MAKDKPTSILFDRRKHQFSGLDDQKLAEIKQAFPGVDVNSELRKMILWLMSPNGLKRKGDINFVLSWLSRVIPKVMPAEDNPEVRTALDPYFDEYLDELWKGREHILALNRRRKKS